VKVTPASQKELPPVALEKWQDTQAGTVAANAWVVRTADDHGRRISLVEADISLHGRPALVIMMPVGTSRAGIRTRPTFRSLHLMKWAGDYAEWHRLRDFPAR
jgi:hypothetical protein